MFFGNSALYSAPFWERFVGWYEKTLLHDLLAYLIDRYFTVHFHVYEHLSVGPEANDAARVLIFGIAIGIIVATVLVSRTRVKLGGFLRKLIAQDAMAPETAKTLSELAEFRNSAVRRELSRGVTLRKFVRCVEEEAYCAKQKEAVEGQDDAVKETESKDQKPPERVSFGRRLAAFFTGRATDAYRIDFTTAHFYLPADLKYRAEVRFERKGSGKLPVVLVCIGAVLFVALTCRFLPDVFQMMDNIIGQMAPK